MTGSLSEDPGIVFAFSGREEGNCSLKVGDGDPAGSRALALATVGLRAADAVYMEQVHGPRVARVGRRQVREAVPAVDALVTTEEGLGLVVLVADCVPLLLAVPGRGVAAVHAGRNGVLAGVIDAAVHQLATATGTRPTEMVAVLGPAIRGCCYEVPLDLAEEVGAVVPAASATTTWGTPALDLPAGVVAQLRAAGVGRVQDMERCTRCHPDHWFSHRAASAGLQPHGRQAGVIRRVAAPAGVEAPRFLH